MTRRWSLTNQSSSQKVPLDGSTEPLLLSVNQLITAAGVKWRWWRIIFCHLTHSSVHTAKDYACHISKKIALIYKKDCSAKSQTYFMSSQSKKLQSGRLFKIKHLNMWKKMWQYLQCILALAFQKCTCFLVETQIKQMLLTIICKKKSDMNKWELGVLGQKTTVGVKVVRGLTLAPWQYMLFTVNLLPLEMA